MSFECIKVNSNKIIFEILFYCLLTMRVLYLCNSKIVRSTFVIFLKDETLSCKIFKLCSFKCSCNVRTLLIENNVQWEKYFFPDTTLHFANNQIDMNKHFVCVRHDPGFVNHKKHQNLTNDEPFLKVQMAYFNYIFILAVQYWKNWIVIYKSILFGVFLC